MLKTNKNILVVNDDGIEAIGIHKLAEALSDAGNVYVCSPHMQQSATGHGITIGRPVYLEDVPLKEAKQAISVEGSPADCVKIGLELFRSRGVEMDMVFSGFNHGHNLGTDTLYSGTVAAAIEGALNGLPSAAMSISQIETNHTVPKHFETAMGLAVKIANSGLFSGQSYNGSKPMDVSFINNDHVILNVNIPDFPTEKIMGIKVCPLSYRAYENEVRLKENDEGYIYGSYAGWPRIIGNISANESDIIANSLGYVTITPLHFDLSNHEMINTIYSEWDTGGNHS